MLLLLLGYLVCYKFAGWCCTICEMFNVPLTSKLLADCDSPVLYVNALLPPLLQIDASDGLDLAAVAGCQAPRGQRAALVHPD